MNELSLPNSRRRRFLQLSTGALVLVPLAHLHGCSRSEPETVAPAAPTPRVDPIPERAPVAAAPEPVAEPAAASPSEMPRLSEDDPTAQALGYRHAASDVDQTRFPRFAAGQNCANCSLFQAGADASWGGCTIFPGQLVNAAGWCISWVPTA